MGADAAVVHERTLLGAIDAHVSSLLHTRPWLAAGSEEALEALAEAWLADGGENWLPALEARWVARHLRSLTAEEHGTAAVAVARLVEWARERGLVADAPPVAARGWPGPIAA